MTVVEHLAELRRRLMISLVAVVAAAGFCYWFAPDIIRWFLDFLLKAGGQELQPLLTADKYVSLVSLMILAFGLAFEFPVLLVFLLLARVLSTAKLIRWRRGAIVLIFAFAAVITPSQDPYSL